MTETNNVSVSGSFGTVTGSGEDRRRQLDIDLRVGDFNLDNTRQVRGGLPVFNASYSPVAMPVEDDADALRAIVWYQTDQKYKRAIEQLGNVRMNTAVKVETEDKAGDFSHAPVERFTEPVSRYSVNRNAWENKIRSYTAPFQRYGNIYEASASLSANSETRWFVSSDGSRIQTSQTYYRLFIYAFTKAPDGMELPRYESYFAFTPEGLPDDATVLKAVDKMIADLKALKLAPIIDPYTGPAILSGRATGVFFHEVFGHRIEGHRQKLEDQSQTFKKMVGDKVLPDFLSVYFDPTERRLGKTDLVGSYRYDNEGTRARRVTAVENGVLKNFLMSRTPIDGFPESNGHGRRQPGFVPVARQSNLIVAAAGATAHARAVEREASRRSQEAGPGFRLAFRRYSGRIYDDRAHAPQFVQCAASDGVPDLRRRAGGTGSRRGPYRYTADGVHEDYRGGR